MLFRQSDTVDKSVIDWLSSAPLAIHAEGRWHRKWIDHCRARGIPHRVVNCYESDVLEKIEDCSGLMWAFNHLFPTDILMARHVLYAAVRRGMKVYPDFDSSWHFDDKIAQKYLFEALGIPAAKAWVFYSKEAAMNWLEMNSGRLPVVAKLRRGAGSYNVRLVKTPKEALSYIDRMFAKGFSPAPSGMADAGNKLRSAYATGGMGGVRRRLMKAPRFFRTMREGRRYHAVEKGYVYFQEYVAGNDCDYRVKVVGDHAWGFRRMVRKNDFRASGSGVLDFDYRKIPVEMVETAFSANTRLKMQSVAFDFVLDSGVPTIVEASYGFGIDEGESDGYWTPDGLRHNESFDPLELILEKFLASLVIERSLNDASVHYE